MTCEALKLPHRPSPQHLIDITKEGTEGRWHITSVIFDPAPRSRLILRAMSANDTSVRLRSFKSRIVVRIAFSAVALTAGVNPQNSSLLLEFFTQRGRKPYPRKSNLTFGYFALRRPSLQ